MCLDINGFCTICSPWPIIIGPKAVRRAVIGPLLVGPVGMECTAGWAEDCLGLGVVIARMHSGIPR